MGKRNHNLPNLTLLTELWTPSFASSSVVRTMVLSSSSVSQRTMCAALRLISIAAAADGTYSYGFDFPDSTEGLPCPRLPGEFKNSFTADYDKSARPRIAERPLASLPSHSPPTPPPLTRHRPSLAPHTPALRSRSTRLCAFQACECMLFG